MGVRFVLGRAGAGKSRHCVEAIRADLLREPFDGPRMILVVPEQASLQTERALLADERLAGTQRGEVLSFRRLAQRVLQARPPAVGHVLTPAGRSMVLQKVVGDLGDRLQYFRSARLLPGLYEQLGSQVEELIYGAVDVADLRFQPDVNPETAALPTKLADLALIYESYLEFLQAGCVDPALFLDQARAALPKVEWLRGTRVWVDGFASFSEQETRFMVALARLASEMAITLLLEPGGETLANGEDPHDLFAPTRQTYRRLQEALRAGGIAVDEPLVLEAAESPERRPGLRHLAANLFTSSRPFDAHVPDITICRAADPREEMDHVVRQILRLTSRSQHPLRYRDLAVITRQLETHHALIASVLQRHHIPYFIDRRPPLSEHPVHHFVRSLLKVATERFSLKSVRGLLKSDLLRLGAVEADRLENYLLAHGIEGLAAWTSDRPWKRDPLFRAPADRAGGGSAPDFLLQRIAVTRGRVLSALQPWMPLQPAGPSQKPGQFWARRLYDTLAGLKVARRLERWAEQADEDGRKAEAAHHRQAWRSVVALFDDFAQALGACEMTIAEFSDSFEAGLTRLDTGLVPPAVDQVVVGAVERSRHPDIKVAFVVGMNDGTFPLLRGEKTLLNDDERAVLMERRLNIDPPRRARLGEERLLAYIALTRASEHLFVSSCDADVRGRHLEPSPYLSDLRALFPAMGVESDAGSEPEDLMSRVTDGQSLVTLLGLQLRSARHREVWDALYERARRRPELQQAMQGALKFLFEPGTVPLPLQPAEKAEDAPLRTSITDLQKYAACPFQHYAAARLKLARRREEGWDALRLGSLSHAVLEHFTRGLLEDGVGLSDLEDDQLATRVKACIAEFNRRFADDAGQPGGSRPFVWHRLYGELLNALAAQRRAQAAGAFHTVACELAFGLSDTEGLAALELTTPKRRRVRVRGKIDRLDLTEQGSRVVGLIFDYKRSRRLSLHLAKAYYGLEIQLVVYLLVLESLGRQLAGGRQVTPGGTFYLNLIPEFEKVGHPSKAGQVVKSYRPRGVFDARVLPLLEPGLEAGDSSDLWPVALTKQGHPYKGCDAVPSGSLRALMDHVQRRVGELCDALMDGDIAVLPYRLGRSMPCSRCDYRALCRFEFPEGRVRQLPRLRGDDVWERLTDGG